MFNRCAVKGKDLCVNTGADRDRQKCCRLTDVLLDLLTSKTLLVSKNTKHGFLGGCPQLSLKERTACSANGPVHMSTLRPDHETFTDWTDRCHLMSKWMWEAVVVPDTLMRTGKNTPLLQYHSSNYCQFGAF